VITLLIIANTVVLAQDEFPMEERKARVLEIINEFFSWCFFSEMVIKLIGLGFKEYSKDHFNLFDATIVVMSLTETIIY